MVHARICGCRRGRSVRRRAAWVVGVVSLMSAVGGCKGRTPAVDDAAPTTATAPVPGARAVRSTPAESLNFRLASDLPPDVMRVLIDRFAAASLVDVQLVPWSPTERSSTDGLPTVDAILARHSAPLSTLPTRPWPAHITALTSPFARTPQRSTLSVAQSLHVVVVAHEADVGEVTRGGLSGWIDGETARLGWCPSCGDTPHLAAEMARRWGERVAERRLRHLLRHGRAYPSEATLLAAVARGDVDRGLCSLAAVRLAEAGAPDLRVRVALSPVPGDPMNGAWPIALAMTADGRHAPEVAQFARFLLADEEARRAFAGLGAISAAMSDDERQGFEHVEERLHLTSQSAETRRTGLELLRRAGE